MVGHPLPDIVVLVINPSPVQPAMFRKLQLKCCILTSATPLVFSSRLSLPSTVLSTTNSHVLNVVTYVESIKTFMSTTITTAYHILVEEISS